MNKNISIVVMLSLVLFNFPDNAFGRGRGTGGKGGAGPRGGRGPGGGGVPGGGARPTNIRPPAGPAGGGGGRPNFGGVNRANLGGGQRPNFGGGGARPNFGGGQRPNVNFGRPNFGGGSNRPNFSARNFANPGGFNRPGVGAGNRPGVGAGSRPGFVNRPGTGPGNLPGIGNGNRPGIGAGTRPGFVNRPGIGDGNRPGIGNGTRPGIGDGNRPGNRPGIGQGNRPDIGDGNRPGFVNRPGIGDGNRPGFGNRPSIGNGNRPGLGNDNRPGIGNGNRPGFANRPGNGNWNRPGYGNWNRPGFGHNNNIGNNFNNVNVSRNNYFNNNHYYAVGGNNNWNNRWHHGYWGGSYWGNRPGWGFGYGRGYRNGYWNAYANRPWYRPWYSNAALWGLGGWALGSVYYDSGYMNYVNPYYVSDAGYYDYSQPLQIVVQPDPIVTVADPVDTSVLDTSLATTAAAPIEPPPAVQASQTHLSAAQDAFLKADYATAGTETDLAIKEHPTDAALHEFRALVYFAVADYHKAAATLYAVLSAGPGWDWTTMSSLYPDVETYTVQLRALEQYVKSNPDAPDGRFVLAYHYITGTHNHAAIVQLRAVARLQPSDQLAVQLIKGLGGEVTSQSDMAATATVPPTPEASQAADSDGPPPPDIDPAKIVGRWTAKRSDGTTFGLDLTPDKKFTWSFEREGKKNEFSGTYTVDGAVLVLERSDKASMPGVVTMENQGFNFKLFGAPDDDPGLDFKI